MLNRAAINPAVVALHLAAAQPASRAAGVRLTF
jgi:hypothetical protein